MSVGNCMVTNNLSGDPKVKILVNFEIWGYFDSIHIQYMIKTKYIFRCFILVYIPVLEMYAKAHIQCLIVCLNITFQKMCNAKIIVLM